MGTRENKSEIARILQQIDTEREAARWGLYGLAIGVGRHDFIQAKQETFRQDAQLQYAGRIERNEPVFTP